MFWTYVLIFGTFLYATITHIYDAQKKTRDLPPVSVFYIMLILSLVTLASVALTLHSRVVFFVVLTILILTFFWHRSILSHDSSASIELTMTLILLTFLALKAYKTSWIALFFVLISVAWIIVLFSYIVQADRKPTIARSGEAASYNRLGGSGWGGSVGPPDV